MESSYYSKEDLNKYHRDYIKRIRKSIIKDLGWFIRINYNGTSLISRYIDWDQEVKDHSTIL